MPKVVKHYKEHIDDDEIFYEGKSAFVLIKTFEKPDVLPKATKSEWSDEYTRRLACSWKNGILGVFASDEQWAKIGWNAPAWVRGKLTVKFDLMGYEQKYHKSIDLACKKNGVDRDSIDDSDVIKNYTLNIWQVVE